jgi:hypothetical protein
MQNSCWHVAQTRTAPANSEGWRMCGNQVIRTSWNLLLQPHPSIKVACVSHQKHLAWNVLEFSRASRTNRVSPKEVTRAETTNDRHFLARW